MQEAGVYTNLSTRTIRRLIADGVLTGHRFGTKVIRVDLNEIDTMANVIPATGRGDVA